MADYKGKLDEWQKTVRRKARELDEKYALSDLVGEGSRAAGEAAKRGAETVASGAEKLRLEAERLSSDGDVADTAKRAASEAVRGAEKAGKVIFEAAGDVGKQAGKTAGEVLTKPRLTTIALPTFTTPAPKLRAHPPLLPLAF